MAQFLRNEKDTEEIILGRDTEKSMSCKWQCIWWRHCYCRLSQKFEWKPSSYLVKTATPLEFWWCPSFHWRSQWIEDRRGTCYEQGCYTYYCLSPVLHKSDSAVGNKD